MSKIHYSHHDNVIVVKLYNVTFENAGNYTIQKIWTEFLGR